MIKIRQVDGAITPSIQHHAPHPSHRRQGVGQAAAGWTGGALRDGWWFWWLFGGGQGEWPRDYGDGGEERDALQIAPAMLMGMVFSRGISGGSS